MCDVTPSVGLIHTFSRLNCYAPEYMHWLSSAQFSLQLISTGGNPGIHWASSIHMVSQIAPADVLVCSLQAVAYAWICGQNSTF